MTYQLPINWKKKNNRLYAFVYGLKNSIATIVIDTERRYHYYISHFSHCLPENHEIIETKIYKVYIKRKLITQTLDFELAKKLSIIT